jgi:hypothetical protein
MDCDERGLRNLFGHLKVLEMTSLVPPHQEQALSKLSISTLSSIGGNRRDNRIVESSA